jgi:hypothetical protein
MFGYIGNVYQLNFNIITSMKQPSESKEDWENFVTEIHDYFQKLTETQVKIIKFRTEIRAVFIDMQISSNNMSQLNKIKQIILENEDELLLGGKYLYSVVFQGNNDGDYFHYDKNLSYFEFCFQYKFTQKFKSKLELLNLSMSELYELINYWFKKATPELFDVDNNTLPSVESIDEYLNEWQHFIRNELHFQYVHRYPNSM